MALRNNCEELAISKDTLEIRFLKIITNLDLKPLGSPLQQLYIFCCEELHRRSALRQINIHLHTSPWSFE